jgi:hypothetical protein
MKAGIDRLACSETSASSTVKIECIHGLWLMCKNMPGHTPSMRGGSRANRHEVRNGHVLAAPAPDPIHISANEYGAVTA